jgi:hypothetical protein
MKADFHYPLRRLTDAELRENEAYWREQAHNAPKQIAGDPPALNHSTASARHAFEWSKFHDEMKRRGLA